MQKHIQHNKDERTQFFRKIYLSLYWKGCVWEGVGDRTKLQHIDPPTLLAIPAFLSRSPRLLNRGPGGAASAGTWFSFQHLLSPTDLNFLSPGWYNNLTSTYFLRASHLYSIQPVNSQGYTLIPWYLRPDAPVIYTGAFLPLTAWPGSICNTDNK